MTSFRLFELCIAFSYFSGALLFLAGLVAHGDLLKRISIWTTVLGFGLHSIDLLITWLDSQGLGSGQSPFYFSLLAWSFLAIFFGFWWRLRTDFLALIASPLALIIFTSSLAISSSTQPIPQTMGGLWFGLHIGALFLSIALLAMAFGSGVTYLYLEKKIKTKERLKGLSRDLPSLNTCDRVNHISVLTGFPLYTMGILSGFIWAAFTWKRMFSWDPKEVVSLIIWLVFAYLFHQRLAIGWNGRKPAKTAIWLFVVVIASMLFINFFVPTHHRFQM
jgi:ABC-type transport system involved in cytochrome c biogenesis permease subunit